MGLKEQVRRGELTPGAALQELLERAGRTAVDRGAMPHKAMERAMNSRTGRWLIRRAGGASKVRMEATCK